jgi:hypothetical protein
MFMDIFTQIMRIKLRTKRWFEEGDVYKKNETMCKHADN